MNKIAIFTEKLTDNIKAFQLAANSQDAILSIFYYHDIDVRIIQNKIELLYRNDLIDLSSFKSIVIVQSVHWIHLIIAIGRLCPVGSNRLVADPTVRGSLAIDKLNDYIRLVIGGVCVPDTLILTESNCERIGLHIGFPCIVKGIYGAMGKQVFKVRDADEAYSLCRRFPSSHLLAQKYIPNKAGDYRIIVVGGIALSKAMKRIPHLGDFRTNNVLIAESVDLNNDEGYILRDCAQRVSKVFGLDFTGIDVIVFKGSPFVLDVNRSPMFDIFQRVTGIDVAASLIKYCAADV